MDALTLEWSENGQRKSECGGTAKARGAPRTGLLDIQCVGLARAPERMYDMCPMQSPHALMCTALSRL